MSPASGEPPPGIPSGMATTRRLFLAAGGDRDSLGWIVDRFDPCLHAAARHHLGTNLRRFLDPQDLVNEVWMVAFRRLPELGEGAPPTPRAFLAFLGSTLRFTLNNWVRKHLRAGRPAGVPGAAADPDGGDPMDRLPAEVTGVTTRARLSEARALMDAALSELDEKDRAVVVLRGFEQVPNQEAAAALGLEPGTVAVRYHRALARLRAKLPSSVFDDLDAL